MMEHLVISDSVATLRSVPVCKVFVKKYRNAVRMIFSQNTKCPDLADGSGHGAIFATQSE